MVSRIKAQSRFISLIMIAMMVVAGIAGAGVSSPEQAAAAGGSAPDLRFCMKYSSGATYGSAPVYLQQWNGSQWVHIRSGRTNTAGCGTWVDIQPSRYYLVQGYWTYSVGSAIYYYNGYTPAKWVGGSTCYDCVFSAGTGWVYGPYRMY